MSEHPEGVRKGHIEEQEVEDVRLPSIDSQCALHEAVDLLKSSYSDLLSEKNSIDKKSGQLFSLIPQQVSSFFVESV